MFKGLSHVAPHAHVLHLNEDFSRDPAVVARINTDPLIAHETQPTRTLAAMVRADEQLERGFPQLRLPLLILHGTADRADPGPKGTRPSSTRQARLTRRSSCMTGHSTTRSNDLDRDTVIGDITTWLEARL